MTGKALGERLNNPLNIELNATRWVGLSKVQQHKRFCTFDTAEDGIRAAAVCLRTYFSKYRLATVEDIVRRWAPPGENDTGMYVSRVCRSMAVQAGEKLDLTDPSVMCRLVTGMMAVELGYVPYTPDLIQGAVIRAYGVKEVATNQPTAAPSRKVSTGAAVSALAGAPLAWIIASLWATAMPDNPMPVEVATAVGSWIGTGVYLLTAYLTTDKVPVA